ncbi:hypothetical protein ACFFXZ_10210 [Massilia antarctica]|nr:hypothetical protein [Massilia antarctica]
MFVKKRWHPLAQYTPASTDLPDEACMKFLPQLFLTAAVTGLAPAAQTGVFPEAAVQGLDEDNHPSNGFELAGDAEAALAGNAIGGPAVEHFTQSTPLGNVVAKVMRYQVKAAARF